LYTFEDAKEGKMKATAAAQACKNIFPSIVSLREEGREGDERGWEGE
jgi:hypothetical protein